jgi:hypothetical protein
MSSNIGYNNAHIIAFQLKQQLANEVSAILRDAWKQVELLVASNGDTRTLIGRATLVFPVHREGKVLMEEHTFVCARALACHSHGDTDQSMDLLSDMRDRITTDASIYCRREDL